MDVDNLTREELLELLAEKKAEPEDRWREVDVDGIAVRVDTRAVKSWKAFDIMAGIGDELTPQAIRRMVDFIEFTTDMTERKMLDLCGGDMASVEDVVELASKILSHCYPKN